MIKMMIKVIRMIRTGGEDDKDDKTKEANKHIFP